MLRFMLILGVALVFEAIGVVFLSRGIKEIGAVSGISATTVVRVIREGAANRNILLGILFEALFFAGLLMMMARGDVSFVWPLTSLSFVMTALAARWFLGEEISPVRWAGICLIVCGAGLVTWSEKGRGAGQGGDPMTLGAKASTSETR